MAAKTANAPSKTEARNATAIRAPNPTLSGAEMARLATTLQFLHNKEFEPFPDLRLIDHFTLPTSITK
jgi:hypothetical protein